MAFTTKSCGFLLLCFLQGNENLGWGSEASTGFRPMVRADRQYAEAADKSLYLGNAHGAFIPVGIKEAGSQAVSGDSARDSPPPQTLSSGKDSHYYAIIIGNRHYKDKRFNELSSPDSDARAIANVLAEKYGFKVRTLIDATRVQLLRSLHDSRESLTESDSLLIYFAGHGSLDPANGRGYWIPVDGEIDSEIDWISHVTITDFLRSVSAKDVLVVSDSAYSGAFPVAPAGIQESALPRRNPVEGTKTSNTTHSRSLITSAGLDPPLDSIVGRHYSPFAECFLEILKANQIAIGAQLLYREVSHCTRDVAAKINFKQQPTFAQLRFAGHESGDFTFVPSGASIPALRAESNVSSSDSKPDRQAFRGISVERLKEQSWATFAAGMGGLFVTYLVGLCALLLLAWRRGSMFASKTWLSSLTLRPLLITPALGKWILFIGYSRRLGQSTAIRRVSTDYFGLPAEGPGGSVILPDSTGASLHQAIANSLEPQEPLLILGKGGAGKSTLIARLTHLALEQQLPSSLNGYRPLLIPASYYGESLTRAIADTLRERDGVMVDDAVIKAQLQSGRFLILFDGVSEVFSDKQRSLDEILRTARNADYRSCRFVIATRPIEGIPPDVRCITLMPLTATVIAELLDNYGLSTARRTHIRLQLRSFGEKPIDPLLFTMMIGQSGDERVSANRAEIYERYFKRLLRIDADRDLWAGWRAAMEILALCFLINTGKRGVGMPHETLLDFLVTAGAKDGKESVSMRLKRLYRLPIVDDLDMLNRLEAAGLLYRGRRWRFAHDTFEEYFAASYIVSYFDMTETLPSLDKWTESSVKAVEFNEVIDFVFELADESLRKRIALSGLPAEWRDRLQVPG